MVIDTRGVELKNSTYIDKEGRYALNITDVVIVNSAKFEVIFEGNEIIIKDEKMELSEETYKHKERFTTNSNVLWKIKLLEVALKAPEIYDIKSFIGRFVNAKITLRDYNDKKYAQVASWSYSKRNDNLPAIPLASATATTADVTIDDDTEIPF